MPRVIHFTKEHRNFGGEVASVSRYMFSRDMFAGICVNEPAKGPKNYSEIYIFGVNNPIEVDQNFEDVMKILDEADKQE